MRSQLGKIFRLNYTEKVWLLTATATSVLLPIVWALHQVPVNWMELVDVHLYSFVPLAFIMGSFLSIPASLLCHLLYKELPASMDDVQKKSRLALAAIIIVWITLFIFHLLFPLPVTGEGLIFPVIFSFCLVFFTFIVRMK